MKSVQTVPLPMSTGAGTADYRTVEETEAALEDGGLSYSHVPDDADILYSGSGTDEAALRCRCPGTEIRHGVQPLCQFRTVSVHGRQIGRLGGESLIDGHLSPSGFRKHIDPGAHAEGRNALHVYFPHIADIDAYSRECG